MPLERIYSNRTQSILVTQKKEGDESEVEHRTFSIDYGNVYARKEGDKFVVDGIHSTNMQDYLNPKYSPGSSIELQ